MTQGCPTNARSAATTTAVTVVPSRRFRSSATERGLVAACRADGLVFTVDEVVSSPHLPPRGRNGCVVGICTPDMTFRPERVAVFYDGCYWHECPDHYPDSFGSSVTAKDARQVAALTKSGWTVLRFWEHDATTAIVAAIREAVRR